MEDFDGIGKHATLLYNAWYDPRPRVNACLPVSAATTAGISCRTSVGSLKHDRVRSDTESFGGYLRQIYGAFKFP